MNKPKLFDVSYIQLEPYKGTQISKVKKEAQEIANELDCIVRYTFNDSHHSVWPKEKR